MIPSLLSIVVAVLNWVEKKDMLVGWSSVWLNVPLRMDKVANLKVKLVLLVIPPHPYHVIAEVLFIRGDFVL